MHFWGGAPPLSLQFTRRIPQVIGKAFFVSAFSPSFAAAIVCGAPPMEINNWKKCCRKK